MLSGLGLGKIFIGSIRIHAIFCDGFAIYLRYTDIFTIFLRYTDNFALYLRYQHICVVSEVSRHKSTDVDAEFDAEQR